MSDEEKLVSHYRLKTLLRKDGFGAVYFAEDTRDQKACVLRVIELDHPTLVRITGRVRSHAQRDHPLIEQIRQRMKRIAELKNTHVLPVIEFGEEHIQGNNDIIFYMASPYEKESLLSYWSARTSRAELLSLEVVSELIFQAAEGLYYVHRRGLVHQYVRLSSFMLRETARSHKLHLYLTDFWFADISAAILEEGQISQDLSVYLAPEQLANRAVAASDQYALAILAYELLLGYRLSQVDLSIGLYEHFLRQRKAEIEVSEAELALAHRLDLVLARALAEDVSARYKNIEEFASMFHAVTSGELVELDEDTAKLPVVHMQRQGTDIAGIAAVAAGGLVAGEVVEDLVENSVEIDEITQTRRPGLHKTVLTSEGMDVVESESIEVSNLSVQETIVGGAALAGAVLASEETITVEETRSVVGEGETRSSAGAVGAVGGFVAGVTAGEALQRESDLSAQQARISEASATAFAEGEARQREMDAAAEKTMPAAEAAAFAAGLAAGEARQRELDKAEEKTEKREESAKAFAAGLAAGEIRQRELDEAEERESGAAGFAAGALLGGAAGLVDGEALTSERLSEQQAPLAGSEVAGGIASSQEIDVSEQQTQIIAAAGSSSNETVIYERETDISEEQTRIIPAAGGILLAGAAGLAAGELLAGGTASGAGGELLSGAAGSAGASGGADSVGVASAGESGAGSGAVAGTGTAGSGAGAAGGMSVLEEAALIGGAAAAGLAAAGLVSEGALAGETTQVAGGAGAGLAAAGGEAGASGGMLQGAGSSASGAGGMSGLEEIGIIGAAAGLVAAGLAAEGAAAVEAPELAGGYAGGAAETSSAGAAGGYASGAGAGLVAGGAAGGVAGGGLLSYANRRRSPRRGRVLLVAIICALLLLLVFGGAIAFAINMTQGSATVTMHLESHTFKNTYVVTATTTTTTTTGSQVQANFLTQRASLSQSGHATGYYPGVEASGFIKLTNSSTGCGCPVFIPGGTPFVSASGVTVVIDYGVSVASLCSVTVPAHAMIYGPGGNIGAGDVSTAYSSHIWATNPYAFTGGQPGQGNALVQQSDIDHVAVGLKAQVLQSAQSGIQSQLKSNQRLFIQPECKARVKSDHAAGDNASEFNVTVTAVCNAEAYDYSSAMQIVQQQVQSEASSYSTDQYVLVNSLQTTVTSATVTDARAGTVLLAFQVVGHWLHRLSNGLERFIAGKSVSDAKAILKQFGAAQVDISISGFNTSTLPSDSSRIKLVVKS